jgi:predicted Zn-dependent peptidase
MPALPTLSVPPIADGKRRVVTHDLDIDEPRVFALFPMPPEGSLDHRIAEMADPPHELLASLAFTYEWGHSADSFVMGGARAPVLAVTVTVRELDDVEDAIDAIWRSMRRARRDSGRSDRPWFPIRDDHKADLLGRFEPLGARAWMFADYIQFGAKGFLVDRLNEIDRVKRSELERVADAIFDPDRATVVVFRPRPGAQRRRTGKFTYRPAAHDPGHWKQMVDPSEADRPVTLPADRRRLPAPQRADLPNGLRVLLWPHGDLPLVHARLIVAAGLSDAPVGRVGAALAAASSGLVGHDATVFSSRKLAPEVHLVLERLSRRLRFHRVEDFDDAREEMLRQLRRPRAAERTRYERALRAATFGADHPYARDMLTESEVRGLDGDAVADFQRSHYTAGNTTVVLTGQFDPALVREHLAYQFGHLDRKQSRRPPVPRAAPRPGQRLVAGAGEAGSPVVELDLRVAGEPGVGRRHGARLVLAMILDAELRELREHQALTYGMSATYDVRRGPGEWSMGGSVDATRASDAVTFILDRLDAMRREPMIHRGNFVVARRALVQQLMTRGNNAAEMAALLTIVAEHDLPDDYFDRLIEEAARVTPDDVHRLLVDEVDPSTLVIGAFGPPPAVDRVLTAARTWRPKK